MYIYTIYGWFRQLLTRVCTSPSSRVKLHALCKRISAFQKKYKIEVNFRLWVLSCIAIGKIVFFFKAETFLHRFRSWHFFLRSIILIKNYWNPHSTVILREYFKNIPLKSCDIVKIFIKLLEKFLKYFRNLAMSAQNIINVMLLQYRYFVLILL